MVRVAARIQKRRKICVSSMKGRQMAVEITHNQNGGRQYNKYQRTIKGTVVDVYDVLHAWEVHNPAIQHAIKKLLQPGLRGHKNRSQDLNEALASIKRAIELETPA